MTNKHNKTTNNNNNINNDNTNNNNNNTINDNETCIYIYACINNTHNSNTHDKCCYHSGRGDHVLRGHVAQAAAHADGPDVLLYAMCVYIYIYI